MKKNCPELGQFFFTSLFITLIPAYYHGVQQNTKNHLGIFTFLPFVLFPIIFFEIFKFIVDIVALNERGDPEASDILAAVFSFIVPVILTSLLCLALLIFYVVHAVANKKLETAEQLLWVLLFVFFGIIAFPVYWIIRIWNTSKNP